MLTVKYPSSIFATFEASLHKMRGYRYANSGIPFFPDICISIIPKNWDNDWKQGETANLALTKYEKISTYQHHL